jgi:outer membrane protein TolC
MRLKRTGSIFRAFFLLALTALPAAGADTDTNRLTIFDALAEAYLKNPVMRESESRIQAAQAGLKSAGADFYPTASCQYGYSSLTETPIMKSAGGSFQTAHRHLYNWNLTVIQPLFTGFALSSRYKIADLDITVRRLEKEQIALDLTRDVKTAYYDLLLTRKLLSVAEEEVQALAAHEKEAALYNDQGLIPYNDLLKSEVALANALQQSEKAQANEQKALVRLNRLLNRPVTDTIQLEDITGISDKENSVPDVLFLSDQALRNRPIMETVRVGLEKLGLARRVAKSSWYPEITLVGRHGNEGDSPAAADNDFSNSHNTSISVQASWRLWDWGKTREEVNQVQHHMAALSAQIESIENQIRQEVKNALLDCGVALKNIATARRSQDQARENWRITNLQYTQQMASSTDVLDARTFLSQTDTNYYQALYGYLTALAALDCATGKPGNHNSIWSKYRQ